MSQCLAAPVSGQTTAPAVRPRLAGLPTDRLLLAPPHRPRREPTVRSPEIDAVFDRAAGWTGADGVHSVPLDDGRVLFLFGDTLVSKRVVDGRRELLETVPLAPQGERFLNNSAAILDDTGFAGLRFVIAGSAEAPRTLFVPPDSEGWFWPGDGAPAAHGATVLLNQFANSSDPRFVFGRPRGPWAAEVEVGEGVNVRRYRRLSWPGLDPDREIVFGAVVHVEGPWTYVYNAESFADGTKRPFVARVPTGQLSDSTAWRFFTGHDWSADIRDARLLDVPVNNELSVDRLPDGRYLMVTDVPLGVVGLRFAPTPIGPWSEAHAVWRCPEQSNTIFSYNAKAHLRLSDARGLLISYNVNSLDLDESLLQADVYRPRFLRVPWSRIEELGRASEHQDAGSPRLAPWAVRAAELARPTPAGCRFHSEVSDPEVETYLESGVHGDMERVRAIGRHLGNIEEMLARVTVELEPDTSSSPYSDGHTVYGGAEIGCRYSAEGGISSLRGTLFHELGHSLFYAYQAEHAAASRERARAHRVVAAATERIRENGQAGRDWEQYLTPAEKRACRLKQIHKTVIVPYHELFADVVAVMTTRRARPNRRDFSTMSTSTDDATYHGHYQFNPVRAFLWREFLRDELDSPERCAELLAQLAEICNAETETLYQQCKETYLGLGDLDAPLNRESMGMPSAPALNERLIARLRPLLTA